MQEENFSDADSSVVEFPTGNSPLAVKAALMPAVAWLISLITNVTLQAGNRGEKLRAASLLVRCSPFATDRMLGRRWRNIWTLAVHRQF